MDMLSVGIKSQLDGEQSRRCCVTYGPKIGNHRVHIAIARDYDDGPIVHVKVDMHQFGSPFREMMRLVSVLTSDMLAAGRPLDMVIDKLLDSHVGGPSGALSDMDGIEGIEYAESVPHLIAHALRMLS